MGWRTTFGAGDTVVCVDDYQSQKLLTEGRTYKVADVVGAGPWLDGHWGEGLVLNEASHPRNPRGEFAAKRFRRVYAA